MFENTSSKTASDYNVDTSVPKLIGIGVVNALSAGLLGLALKSVIGDGGVTAGNIFAIVGASVLFLSLFLLQILFIKSFKVQNMVVGGETVAMIAPFLLSWSWGLILAIVLLYLLMLRAAKHGMAQMDNQVKIHFLSVERHTIPALITGLSVFISILYVSVNGIGASFMSKDALRVMLKPADPVMQALLSKDFSVDMSISKFTEILAAKQFGDAFTNLPAGARSQATAELLNQLHTQAAGYGIKFKNSDTVNDIFYSYFVKQFNLIPESYRSLIPYIIFVLTYLTVRSLGGLVRWLVSTPAYVLYQLLLSIGFARIGVESRSREIVIVG